MKIAGLPDKLYVPELAGLKDGAEIVGTLFEPDLEALSELSPDLIIVGGRSSPKLAATSRIAQSIDMTMEGDDLFAQAKQRLRHIRLRIRTRAARTHPARSFAHAQC